MVPCPIGKAWPKAGRSRKNSTPSETLFLIGLDPSHGLGIQKAISHSAGVSDVKCYFFLTYLFIKMKHCMLTALLVTSVSLD